VKKDKEKADTFKVKISDVKAEVMRFCAKVFSKESAEEKKDEKEPGESIIAAKVQSFLKKCDVFKTLVLVKAKNYTHRFKKIKIKKIVRSSTGIGFFLILPLALFIGIAILIGGIILDEMMTSEAQAKYFHSYAQKAKFFPEPKKNDFLKYPKFGPYNERLGYTMMPFYIRALEAEGYEVVSQMHASPAYDKMLKRGLYPLYHPKTVAGLTFFDQNDNLIYSAIYPRRVFNSFEEIPVLLVLTLLQVEDRSLLNDEAVPTKNPVIEWSRFMYAIWGQFVRFFNPEFSTGGGSTLATQIEKFRFSPKGQTSSMGEKLRQIASASMKIYMDSTDTTEVRRQIVLDYLNSTPFSARPGFGEVNSIGDALWAWFNMDLANVSAVLNLDEASPENVLEKAKAYRAVLGLILSQRRPSYYLITNRNGLENLIDAALYRLSSDGVISKVLRDAALQQRLAFAAEPPVQTKRLFIDQKAINAFRYNLMKLLDVRRLYVLDRLDLAAKTTIDSNVQQHLVTFLKKMNDPEFVKSMNLYGYRLIRPNDDLSKIKWSVVLYEKGETTNKVRLQADNIDGPFDLNDGMKLDLGSTAKLRTVITYLEIIAELYEKYKKSSEHDLRELLVDDPDALTSWALNWIISHKAEIDAETALGVVNTEAVRPVLYSMLEDSLDRYYSGSTKEVFFTGGGIHTFKNFERKSDDQVYTVRDAFKHSVNLVFVRLMRDIVNYTIGQGLGIKSSALLEHDLPQRQLYLERFADDEGAVFLGRFITIHRKLSKEERLKRLAGKSKKSAAAKSIVFFAVYPKASLEDFTNFIKSLPEYASLSSSRIAALFDTHSKKTYSLNDMAYISGTNPIELWLVEYLGQNPDAPYKKIMEDGKKVRIDSYSWLYRKDLKKAQNTRIRIMLEKDAFEQIHKRWASLGYPFKRLVPSFATSFGSSADRPGSLAELVSVLLSDGVKKPTERFKEITFARDTPYETVLNIDSNFTTKRVLPIEVAMAAKKLMKTPVSRGGTASRLIGVYKDADGKVLPVGGKTGTGDQRYDEFSSAGKKISSRAVNRSGTFLFYIGDRFFGTVTAFVGGSAAADYTFTSSLPAQMLKALAPIINTVVNGNSVALADLSFEQLFVDKISPAGAKSADRVYDAPEAEEINEAPDVEIILEQMMFKTQRPYDESAKDIDESYLGGFYVDDYLQNYDSSVIEQDSIEDYTDRHSVIE